MPTLNETRDLMMKAHDGQVDKGGFPYFTHPDRVLAILISKFDDATDAEKHAALLHDVLEDTYLTESDLRDCGYDEETIFIVKSLSRDKSDGLSYQQWIENICTLSKSVARVKICDNEDNNSSSRIAQLPLDQQSISKRYTKAHKTLLERLNRE